MISALSIHLTPIKTWNRVYKYWVRPGLQHDGIRCPGHYVTVTAYDHVISANAGYYDNDQKLLAVQYS